MTELAGRVQIFQMRSGWFDCTEPSLTTALQGKQGVQGARALVRGGSSVANLLEPQHRKVCSILSKEFGVVCLYRPFSNYFFTGETRCAGCSCTRSGWFKRSEPPRTFSNHFLAELKRCVEVIYLRSGWFDCAEPSLP